MDDAIRRRIDEVCARFNAAPYYHLVGMTAASDRPGHARLVLPFRPELASLYGVFHGGALLALADSAINIALATTFEAAELTATVDVSLSFLASAGHRDLEAEGVVTRRGKRVAFGECVIRAGGEEVARGKGICYVSPPRP